MNPEDVRKLIGGYATGSLSEAERKLLFEAALKDEALFDELAGEQVLKEILEEPGARQRLLSALGGEPKPIQAPWWSKPWPWMGAAVTVAVAIIIVVAQRTPVPPLPPQQVAQVLKSVEPIAPPPPPPPPAATPKALRKVAPPPASVDAIAEARADKAEPQALADAPPPPAAAPRALGGAAAGFAAGRRAEALSANIVSVFGFNYTVRADRVLEIIPSSPGFLSVADGDNVLRPNGLAPAGMPVRVQIPAGTMSVTIGFYAIQGSTGVPVRRDETSGTVTDQDPPNRRISIQLFLTPGTQ